VAYLRAPGLHVYWRCEHPGDNGQPILVIHPIGMPGGMVELSLDEAAKVRDAIDEWIRDVTRYEATGEIE
jgi:hypothetical protein